MPAQKREFMSPVKPSVLMVNAGPLPQNLRASSWYAAQGLERHDLVRREPRLGYLYLAPDDVFEFTKHRHLLVAMRTGRF
jgi:hypothetical protein